MAANAVDERVFVGVDVGGTKILGLLIDAHATVLQRMQRATPTGGNTPLSAAVIAIAGDLIRIAHAQGRMVAGVAICSPGFIDETGQIVEASNLHVFELPLRRLVEHTLGLPTFVMHDVAAAALGEVRFGAAQHAHHVAFCNIGTGIGLGLVFDGHVYRGAGGRAGEFGHFVMERDGPNCSCGKRGCLEALASGWALVRQARSALAHTPDSLLAQRFATMPSQLQVEQIAQAAAAGDGLACCLLTRAAEQVGLAIAGLIHVLALDCVVFGGGVVQSGDPFLQPLRAMVRQSVFDVYQDIALPRSQLGSDAGAIGAVVALHDAIAAR